MYFVFAFGFLAVGAAGRFAWRGEHQLVAFVRWMLATVLCAGAFGFVIGMMQVFSYMVYRARPEQRWLILFEGSKEALNNVSAALLFVMLGLVLVAVGYRRFPAPNASSVLR